ncbi:MAG: CPBP family intramembrane metalloprotease [Candidatus Cloacimonadota bacterium]|nr:MAG: CPBP family intramembrane metalloprotease [Candidatus Cloacimonadota bacterium]
MKEKLNKKDFWFIGVCIVIAVITCIISLRLYNRAFPEASLDFKVTRGEAKIIAEDFLLRMDLDISDYKYASRFRYDNDAKTFLEKELGLEETNRLLKEKIKLWKWSSRWFKPLEKEEFTVDISPGGELLGFAHLLPEDEGGTSLTEDEAKNISVNFIKTSFGKSLSELKFVESNRIERPSRVDWTFIWKEKGLDIRGATYRYSISIAGDLVTGYSEYLKIPEKWERNYSRLRSLNNAAGTVDSFFMVLIALAILVLFIKKIRLRILEIRFSILFGLVAFVLSFLAALNGFSFFFFYYDTTTSLGGYILEQIFSTVMASLLAGIAIFLITAVAESLYREHYRKKISVKNIFSLKALSTKKFFISNIVGLTLAFFFIFYQIIFYIIANKFGAWAPTEVPYSEMLNTKFPWLFVLLVGFFPAVSEEFIFRMFAIPFLKKIFRFTWIALIVSGFIWGFGHATYPNQPFYIRGIEVGLAGILVGYLMLRFNIFAVFIWHYTIDAFYTAFLLFRSHNPYFILSGAFAAGIMFIPLILSIVRYIKSKGFEPDEKLLNERYETPVPVEERMLERLEPQAIPYRPLPTKRIVIALIIVFVLSSLFYVKIKRIGSSFQFRIGKREALETTTKFLGEKNVTPEIFMKAVYPERNFDAVTAKYIMEKGGVEGVNRILLEKFIGPEWKCRYFKPLVKDEYNFSLDPLTGEVSEFLHKIKEEKEGEFLEENEAKETVLNFLKNKDIDQSQYTVKESSSEDKKNRRDYYFVLEKKEGNIDEAKQRLGVGLSGSEVSSFSKYLKIPEKYIREREKRTTFSVILLVVRTITSIFFITFAIYFFILRFNVFKSIRKKIIITSVIFTILSLLDRLNRIPQLLRAYDTSIPFNVYLVSVGFGTLLLPIGIFIITYFSIQVIFSTRKETLFLLSGFNVRRMLRDALIITFFSVLIFFILKQARDIMFFKFPSFAVPGLFSIPYAMDAYLPFYSNLFMNILKTIITVSGIAVFIEVFTKHIKKYYQKILILILVIISFIPETLRGSGELFFNLFLIILFAATVFLLLKYLFRNNFLAYPLSIYTTLMLVGILRYVTQPAFSIRINGYILIPFLLLPYILLFVWSRQPAGIRSME